MLINKKILRADFFSILRLMPYAWRGTAVFESIYSNYFNSFFRRFTPWHTVEIKMETPEREAPASPVYMKKMMSIWAMTTRRNIPNG